MLKTIFAFLAVLFVSAVVAAADSHGESAIPGYFKWQVFNFVLFAILLFVLFKNRLPVLFASRRDDFLAHERKARLEKEEALKAKKEVESDIHKLVTGRAEGLERAKREASLYAEKMKQEAKALEQRLSEELARTEAIEMEKVAYSVRTQLIERSVAKARTSIKNDLVEADDKRLQNEFVEKIQVVN